MASSKSAYVKELDGLQSRLRPFLNQYGFRSRRRTFNRATSDGLTQLVQLQMGSFDPPGTAHIPGMRENLYGRFTVNLGVYIPEVARYQGGEARSFVQQSHCCLRRRLGQLGPEQIDIWWPASSSEAIAAEITTRLERDAFPYFQTYETRDAILESLRDASATTAEGGPPRIMRAIILAGRGEHQQARGLLAAQARENRNPGHAAYLRRLATELGLGPLDG